MIVQTRPGQTYRETDNGNSIVQEPSSRLRARFLCEGCKRCAAQSRSWRQSHRWDQTSLAIHATTERRASDHPPPTASRIKGQKVTPALEHCEAVPRNVFIRDSTELKMPAVDVESERAGPNLKALVMEKSHASCPPLGPRGTQTSAGWREASAGSGGSGSGGRSSSMGSRGIRRPGFSRTVPRLALSSAAEWTTPRVTL